MGGVVAAQILEDVTKLVGPCVDALVHAKDLVPLLQKPECVVGADLTAGASDEDVHIG
jgi:hypothetical protein